MMSNRDVYAHIIADSIKPSGERITTMEVRMHRFVLSEFNTHRAFSRNSASSRAIPVRKTIDQVFSNPAYPLVWTSEQPGMVGGHELHPRDIENAASIWADAASYAVFNAQRLQHLGVHKSIINRLLEPFMMHTVVVTATDWNNFFAQRCHPDAQPEIAAAADAMSIAMANSTPVERDLMTWHLPYIQPDEIDLPIDIKKRLSVARCARVSYMTHNGQRSHEKDIELYDRLLRQDPPHASPFEHVAKCAYERRYANFNGWMSLRYIKGI